MSSEGNKEGTAPPQQPHHSHCCESDSDDDCTPAVRSEQPTKDQLEQLLSLDISQPSIELSGLRIFSLDEVPLEKLHNCTALALRKNLIHELKPNLPEFLAAQLVELDFFDNKIKHIGGKKCTFFSSSSVLQASSSAPPPLPPSTFTTGFRSLVKLDLSYNQIAKIRGLDALGPTLEELYLVENRIKTIEGLSSLVQLKLLELGGNRIREIGNGLSTLVKLEQLWLGKNKVTSLGTSLHGLRSLQRLSLQANRLTEITAENFCAPPPPTATADETKAATQQNPFPNLRELYLSENGLTSIQHIGHLHAMEVLDYSLNEIATIDASQVNAQNMPRLKDFWITDAKIGEWKEVEKFAGFSETLRCVYFERNPIEQQDKRYRDKVFMYLPFLTDIDSWPVIHRGNLEADRSIHRKGGSSGSGGDMSKEEGESGGGTTKAAS